MLVFIALIFQLGMSVSGITLSISSQQITLGLATILAFLVILILAMWAINRWMRPPTEE